MEDLINNAIYNGIDCRIIGGFIMINGSPFPLFEREEIEWTINTLLGKNELFNELKSKYDMTLNGGFYFKHEKCTIILSLYDCEIRVSKQRIFGADINTYQQVIDNLDYLPHMKYFTIIDIDDFLDQVKELLNK